MTTARSLAGGNRSMAWPKSRCHERTIGMVNICMVDGHVESLTMKNLEAPDKDYTMIK